MEVKGVHLFTLHVISISIFILIPAPSHPNRLFALKQRAQTQPGVDVPVSTAEC
jgi:hypothetical protein